MNCALQRRKEREAVQIFMARVHRRKRDLRARHGAPCSPARHAAAWERIVECYRFPDLWDSSGVCTGLGQVQTSPLEQASQQ
jgi:hypothetical protein